MERNCMKVIVTLEHRFRRTPDGTVWSRTMFGYPFWTRYLEVFDEVKVVSRVLDVEELDAGWKPSSGDGVQFHAVPHYHGFGDYLRTRRKVRKSILSAYEPDSAIICRLASQLGSCFIPLLRKRRHPYGVEVVGDPWDVFSPSASTHPLRPFFRRIFAHRLRQQCQNACAAAYVTEYAIQKRYPPASNAYTTHYSSIELLPEAFADKPREPRLGTLRRRIICVGTLDQMYKAPDVLIDSVAQCVKQGLDLELVWIGDGKHRAQLEHRAENRGLKLNDQMLFRGQLPAGQAVRDELDRADLFVLPSRQEGLPRALIEAMARGLPAIGSNIGGISELLPRNYLVPPNAVELLASCITKTISDTEMLAGAAKANLHRANSYRNDVLKIRYREFYRQVMESTEKFIDQRR